MTQLEYAKNNKLTPLMKRIALKEGISPKALLHNIKVGSAVILKNRLHNFKNPCAVGKGLATKVNANIGTSTDKSSICEEINKLKTAIKHGADAVMDLSVGLQIKKTREAVLRESSIPVGTVPIYEIAVNSNLASKSPLAFDYFDMLKVLEEQAKEGVDFFTIHSGVNKKSLAVLQKSSRILGIVSRGGAIITRWMQETGRENPFFKYFDEILDIAYRYDVVLSLGDAMRPGSVVDANDKPQFTELKILGELALRARKKNVSVIIEGPGHVPINKIKENIILEKKLCHKAPFYVLGPLVTDIASGYDHITSAIGGALAASYGADFLCYVTPAEHLKHPNELDVREGVIASKIAAHAADIVKRKSIALRVDRQISLSRKKRDWKKQIKLSIDPEKALKYRESSKPKDSEVCTMCGNYCSIKLMES